MDSGGLKITGSVSGTGSVTLDKGSTLELGASATLADTQTVKFAGDGAELQLDGSGSSSSFGLKIDGLAATDKLDLKTIDYGDGSHTTATYDSNAQHTGGVLTVTDGTHSTKMTLVGDYRFAHFAGSNDDPGDPSSGHTLITLKADDDAPTITAGKTGGGSVSEQAATTGSSTSDPSTPVSGTIGFSDVDLVDRPTAKITSQTVTWTGSTSLDLSSLTSGQLAALNADLEALKAGLAVTTSGNNNGIAQWTYSIIDNKLDFLGAGQTATIESTITISDGYPDGTDAAKVTITIAGTNDQTVLASVNSASVSTTVAESADDSSTQNIAPINGSLAFSDKDIGDSLTASPGPVAILINGQALISELSAAQAATLTAALDHLTFGAA